MSRSVSELVYSRLINKNLTLPFGKESPDDPLIWLTWVFPRFEEFYIDVTRDFITGEDQGHYPEQFKPPVNTYCLINVPEIVGFFTSSRNGSNSLSQDKNGICSWTDEMTRRPEINWTYICPPGPGAHFRSNIHIGYWMLLTFHISSRFPGTDNKYPNVGLCDQGYRQFILRALKLAGNLSSY